MQEFLPARRVGNFTCRYEKLSKRLFALHIHVSPRAIAPAHDHVAQSYRHYARVGIAYKNLPPNYTSDYFAKEITTDTAQFLYHHFINSLALQLAQEYNGSVLNWPRLDEVLGTIQSGFTYRFVIAITPQIDVQNWRHVAFNKPVRKKYADLDQQVAQFMSKEQEKKESLPATETIGDGSWVQFSADLAAPKTTLAGQQHYWIQLNVFDSAPLNKALLTTPCNTTTQIGIPSLFSDDTFEEKEAPTFVLKTEAVIPKEQSILPSLQHMFSLPDDTAVHNKLIELFSTQHDICLRKTTVHDLMHELRLHYRFDVSTHAVTRRTAYIIDSMHRQKETQIYTKNPTFSADIGTLAEQQVKDEAVIDAIAHYEQVAVTQEDINAYMQLLTHDKASAFIHFVPTHPLVNNPSEPVTDHIIRQAVRREKTLNSIIAAF